MSPEKKTTTLAVAAPYFVTSFDPSMKGIRPITRIGVEVPTEKAPRIRELARMSGVALKTL